MHPTATRDAAFQRLNEFLPRAGQAYANGRNYDDGAPGDHAGDWTRKNVSQLSPWLHSGLISEGEVIDAVLTQHSPRAADKFTAEVFWRVYFKGYLEQRPSIWGSYCEERDSAFASMTGNAGLRTAYDEATEGRTGIAAFDHWAQELIRTGYLHNHARMWFASIWIFTLKLDWTLGADFFLRHLVDGDAASNTLSWRWVAGLHTKGKTYLARADNIARFTANQPDGPLDAQGLADEAPALSESTDHERGPLDLPAPIHSAFPDGTYALLLHDEGASHAPLNLQRPPSLILGYSNPQARSPEQVGDHACAFPTDAVEAGLEAAGTAFGCEARMLGSQENIESALKGADLDNLALPYLTTGWTRDAVAPEIDTFMQAGKVTMVLDDLNRATWPFAKAGFFGVKKKIESILGEVGIAGSDSDAAE